MLQFFKEKNVFITGHTGFQGSWLSLILKSLGANVTGYALQAEEISHYNLINLDQKINSICGNINDLQNLQNNIEQSNPDIIFHLAAQPIVRRSYRNPIETWQTNVIGTLNVLESTKNLTNLRAIVNITTDKCYENKEWCWAYRENDQLGGHDPYSASKAAVEILSESYKKSFLRARNVNMATVRAGNVIGGGDFGEDRLITTIIDAIKNEKELQIRNPKSVRPWQHVIEALYGYMILAERLYNSSGYDKSYNLGPNQDCQMTVMQIVDIFKKSFNNLRYKINIDTNNPHEAKMLTLDSSLAKNELNWQPLFGIEKTLTMTIEWYKSYVNGLDIGDITMLHIDEFLSLVQ